MRNNNKKPKRMVIKIMIFGTAQDKFSKVYSSDKAELEYKP